MKGIHLFLLTLFLIFGCWPACARGLEASQDGTGESFLQPAPAALYVRSSRNLGSSRYCQSLTNCFFHIYRRSDLTEGVESDPKITLTLPAVSEAGVRRQFGPVSIPVDPTWDNATFASQVCSRTITANMVTITVSTPELLYVLPPCLYDRAGILFFSANNVIAANTSCWLQEARSIECKNCRFGGVDDFAASAAGTNFMNDNGTIIWSRFLVPSLALLRLDSCRLSGTLPERLTRGFLSFDVPNNNLNGPIPSTLLSDLGGVTTLQVTASNNRLEGPLPSALFSSPSSVTLTLPSAILTLDFQENAITGSIPNDMLIGNGAEVAKVEIFLNNNLLTGSIPGSLLPNMNVSHGFILDLSGNRLTGAIPSTLLSPIHPITGNILSALIDLHDNALNGTLAPTLLDGWLPIMSMALNVANNQLEGQISPSLFAQFNTPSFQASSSSFRSYVNLSRNDFSGTLPSMWSNISLASLDVQNNPKLNGFLQLFNSSKITYYQASNTSSSGLAPQLAASNLADIRLDDTRINFCSVTFDNGLPRQAWTPNAALNFSCSLMRTSACSCPSFYPGCDIYACPADYCLTPPPTYQTPAIPFSCVNGTWTFNSSLSTPVLTLPPGSSETIVSGNLTTGSIVIASPTANLTVYGCVYNLSSITISLTLEELEKMKNSKLGLSLLSYDSNCDNIDSVNVIASVKNGGCKKVKVTSKKGSNHGSQTLSAFFSIDSSRCNRWWIILVSVVCGVIVLAVIILAILVATVPSIRSKIRPFSNASERRQQGTLK